MMGVARLVFSMELRKIISYRADFWINFLGQSLFSLIVYYFIWESIFSYKQVDSIRGYNLSQMLLYYLITPLIIRIICGENIGHISREIYDGNLNKYLIYPVNYFVYKLTSYFAYSFFYLFQLFILLIVFKFIAPDPSVLQFNIFNCFLFTISIFFISALYFFLSSMTELIAFWAEYIWSLGVILRFVVGFLGGAMIPLSFFPDWANQLLVYTPFPYLVAFPASLIMGTEIDLETFVRNLAIISIWTIIFFNISYYIWRRGNNQYTGIGM